MDSLKRLKMAKQHENTSLKEVLPYSGFIMGTFYRARGISSPSKGPAREKFPLKPRPVEPK